MRYLKYVLLKSLLILSVFAFFSCNDNHSKESDENARKADSLQMMYPATIIAPGRIQPKNGIVNLSTSTDGIVEKIYVEEGDTVKKGQKILELNHNVIGAKLVQARADFQQEEQQLITAGLQIKKAANDFEQAKANFNRTLQLYRQQAETLQQLDDDSTKMANAKIALENAKASLEQTKKQIQTSKAQVDVIQNQLGEYIIRADTTGVILEMDAKPGAFISSSASFAKFAPESAFVALCEVDQLFANQVQKGQSAYLRIQGFQDTIATGSVIYAAPFLTQKSIFTDAPGEQKDRRVRQIKILIDSTYKPLLIYQKVEAVINTR